MEFKHYEKHDYNRLIRFFMAFNNEDGHNLNDHWARIEWMMFHPYYDASISYSNYLLLDHDEVVGVALYDMRYGEVIVATLKAYEDQFQILVQYALDYLSDHNGLRIAIKEDDVKKQETLSELGFEKTSDAETLMYIDLGDVPEISLPEGYHIREMIPSREYEALQWLIYQGFDHGEDYDAFLKQLTPYQHHPHTDPYLCLSLEDSNGKKVAFCGLWFDHETEDAYIEPVCVIPAYRGKNLAKTLLNEGLRRVKGLGARRAYVLSDFSFYEKLGFKVAATYRFYHKCLEHPTTIMVNENAYTILRLLGKGKGGYSYLAEKDDHYVVLKQIHHEPCEYYQFGNKIEAEMRDYKLLLGAGIRIPTLIEVDEANERIVKEFIDGPVIFDLVNKEKMKMDYIVQAEIMARLAKEAGLNIDYYSTNFVVRDNIVYYIDYECNPYMDEWSFETWGKKYWSMTEEYLAAYNESKKHH